MFEPSEFQCTDGKIKKKKISFIHRIKEILDALPMGGGMSQGGEDLNPTLDMTKVPPDNALYIYLTKTYRMWRLTANVRDPDMGGADDIKLSEEKGSTGRRSQPAC